MSVFSPRPAGLISAGHSAALLGAGEPDGLWPRDVGGGIEPAGEAGMRPTMNHRSTSAVRSDALVASGAAAIPRSWRFPCLIMVSCAGHHGQRRRSAAGRTTEVTDESCRF